MCVLLRRCAVSNRGRQTQSRTDRQAQVRTLVRMRESSPQCTHSCTQCRAHTHDDAQKVDQEDCAQERRLGVRVQCRVELHGKVVCVRQHLLHHPGPLLDDLADLAFVSAAATTTTTATTTFLDNAEPVRVPEPSANLKPPLALSREDGERSGTPRPVPPDAAKQAAAHTVSHQHLVKVPAQSSSNSQRVGQPIRRAVLLLAADSLHFMN